MKCRAMRLGEKAGRGYVTEKMVTVPERLVKCIWYDMLFDAASLRTVDGRGVRVVSPGEWNVGAGPDFRGARLHVDGGCEVTGDVEIHVRAGDWYRHGHAGNGEYGSVALHVVMWNDTGEDFVKGPLGLIPQLALAGCMAEELPVYEARIAMESYPYNSQRMAGHCSAVAAINTAHAQLVVEMAARQRLFAKTARFRRTLTRQRMSDVLYAALMDSMGYGRNRKQFRRLAAAVPLRALIKWTAGLPEPERVTAIESTLLGMAGFLPPRWECEDEETAEFTQSAMWHWDKAQKVLRGSGQKKEDWRLSAVRPANHPMRRIAGISRLIARNGDGIELVMKDLAARLRQPNSEKQLKKILRETVARFTCDADGYWATRMLPGTTLNAATPALIGKSLAMAIVLNIVMPMLMIVAQEDTDLPLRDGLLTLYSVFPGIGENAISHVMSHRLWHGTPIAGRPPSREMERQGLMQIFFDFCDGNIKNCASCGLPAMLKSEE